jgi:hypothetical protein
MLAAFSKFLDRTSEFLAHRKGMLPLAGILFVLANMIIRLALPGWLAETDLFLHVGIILAVIGFMIAWAL